MFTAIVLTPESAQKLKNYCQIPCGWVVYCHHMTINMGDITLGPLTVDYLDKIVKIKVVSVAKNDKIMAVGVETDIASNNKIKHITVAANNVKPKESNNLEDWLEIEAFELEGVIKIL